MPVVRAEARKLVLSAYFKVEIPVECPERWQIMSDWLDKKGLTGKWVRATKPLQGCQHVLVVGGVEEVEVVEFNAIFVPGFYTTNAARF